MSADWIILHGGALGDLVLTIQLALRLSPHVARITVVSRVDPGDLRAGRPAIQHMHADALGVQWLYADSADPPPQLQQALRGAHVLSALGDADSAVHERLYCLRPRELWSIDPRPDPRSARHVIQQWQTRLEAQGRLIPKCIHQRPSAQALGVPDVLRQRGRALRGANDERVAVIHAGSGGAAKCWPVARFRDVASGLRALRLRPHFIVGPAELERWPIDVLGGLARDFRVMRSTTANELAAVLTGADVYLGNDSGPSHLAALLGTPTVVLFGPTQARVWRPMGPCVTCIQGDPQLDAQTWGIDVADVLSACGEARERAPGGTSSDSEV